MEEPTERNNDIAQRLHRSLVLDEQHATRELCMPSLLDVAAGTTPRHEDMDPKIAQHEHYAKLSRKIPLASSREKALLEDKPEHVKKFFMALFAGEFHYVWMHDASRLKLGASSCCEKRRPKRTSRRLRN